MKEDNVIETISQEEYFDITHRDGLYIINEEENPTIFVARGETYTFNLDAEGHPFWIKTEMTTGQENSYNEGVENNGTEVGTITFTVPDNAPETLYYACEFHDTMQGEIEVITREEMSIRKLIVRYLIT